MVQLGGLEPPTFRLKFPDISNRIFPIKKPKKYAKNSRFYKKIKQNPTQRYF